MNKKLCTFICVPLMVLAPLWANTAHNNHSGRNVLYKESLRANDTLFKELSYMLKVMEEVAAWKWAHDAKIEDKAQEKKVLQVAWEKAEQEGLDPQSTVAFFEVQIDLAKKVQKQLYENWREEGFPDHATYRDLSLQLRPDILKTRENIIHNLKQSAPILRDPKHFEQHLEVLSMSIDSPYIDAYDKMRLLEAMIAISEKSA